MTRGWIKTVDWFSNKLNAEIKGFHMLAEHQHLTDELGLDDTTFLVFDVIAETEKAYKLEIEAETFGGTWKKFTTWMPKSVILEKNWKELN